MGQDVSINGPWWPNMYKKKYLHLSAFIFFQILHGYVSKTYPTSIGIGYVSRYPIRYGLKYPCFVGVRRVHDPRFDGLPLTPTRLLVEDEDGRNDYFDSSG
jgi:hypothetical protein